MSVINFTIEDDGLSRVKILRPIRKSEHSEKIQLNCAHPNLKLFFKYYYEKTDNVLCNGNFEFNVWLTLTFDENSSGELNERTRPCDVWSNVRSVNGVEKIPLNKTSLNEWKSKKIMVQYPCFPTVSLNCLLSIKFDTIKMVATSCGEKNLIKHIKELFVNQTNCDVQFCFDYNQRIGGHITILSARSPVFAAMFQHDMKERQEGQVDIRDIKILIFKQLLHYIYSGRLETPLSEDVAQLLYVAADMYDIDDLKEECIEFLLSHIRVDTCVQLLAWAYLRSVDKLQEATLDFTSLHGNEICQLDDWANLAKSYPDLCVSATRRMMANMSVVKQPRH